MQLGVEKYISDRESSGRLPSRALVSLDIVNMFNAISRERLREIIAADFPSLEGFADMLYDEDGETYVIMEDGSWSVIPVTEGFAQGCRFPALCSHRTQSDPTEDSANARSESKGEVTQQ